MFGEKQKVEENSIIEQFSLQMFIPTPKYIIPSFGQIKEYPKGIYLKLAKFLFLWAVENTKLLIKNNGVISCNLCGWQGNSFFPAIVNNNLRINHLCPRCNSQPKDRSFVFYLNKSGLSQGKQEKIKILDVGPSRCVKDYFSSQQNISYIAIDLFPDYPGIVKMDVTKLDFPDRSFDMIFCLNVLEHVKDDLKALGELRRVLRSKGMIILSVPQKEGLKKTIEYPKPDKLQSWHVREYGADLVERFRKAGLKVEMHDWSDYFTEKDKEKYGLKSG